MSCGQFSRPAAPPSALSLQAPWRHISDRRRPLFSSRNTWSYTSGRRASTRGLMRSYLWVPQLTYAARPRGGGAPQEAISPPPAAAFRGEVAAQSREVTHSWSIGGRAPVFSTSLTPAGSSAGKMRAAQARLTPFRRSAVRHTSHFGLSSANWT
jgi:hypothetical protein